MEPDDWTLGPFDHEQSVALFKAIRVAPEGGATEEEMQMLVDWAHFARTRAVILDLLLAGEIVVIGFEGDKPRFATPEAADRKDAVTIAEQIARQQGPS